MTDQRTWAREVVNASVVPAARVTDLIVSKTSNDLLVYDQRTHHIHHLNEAAAAIWRMCDGQRSIGEVAREFSGGSDRAADVLTIRAALSRLDDAGLLLGPLPDVVRVPTQTRRRFLRRVAAGGVAIPMIASMTAPTAAQSMSPPAYCPKGYVEPGWCVRAVLHCPCTEGLGQFGICEEIYGTILCTH